MSVAVVQSGNGAIPEWTRQNVASLERSILGAVLLKPESWGFIRQRIDSGCFYYEKHRALFEAIESVAVEHGQPDFMLVVNELRGANRLEAAGGISYLANLAHCVPAAANLEAHIHCILEIRSSHSGEPVSIWPELVPIGPGKLPEFPVDALPPVLAQFVEEQATAAQTPAALPAMTVIGACSAAIMGKAEVCIRGDWVETLNTYTSVVMSPASRKSQSMSAAKTPLEQWESEQRKAKAAEVQAARAYRDVLEGQVKEAKTRAAKAKGDDAEALIREAVDLAQRLESFQVPALPRLLVDDTTPEQLAVLLSEQSERMAIFSAEGTVFELMTGRYSQNGGGNFELFLQAYRGESYTVDRKGKAPIELRKPLLTICLAVQPDVIESMAKKPGLRGRGMFGRFLYAIPENNLGTRRIAPPSVSPEARIAYNRAIERLMNLGTPGEAVLMRFDANAEAVFRDFEEWLEPRLGPFGDLGGMPDWGGKLAGTTARIAGLIHLAKNLDKSDPRRLPITGETVMSAISVAAFCIPHAQAVYQDMEADPQASGALHLLEWIRKERRHEFTRREIHQGCRGKFRKIDQLRAPLDLLKSHGYIRLFEDAVKRRKGPPSDKYLVNPAVYEIEDIEDANAPARVREERKGPIHP